jgi:ATP-binding cassette, subfamily G (WHITE), member 2, SNQ2
VVPYSQITAFWRYWLYYLDPFTYLVGGLVTPVTWDIEVQCTQSEMTTIPLPSNTTCGEYMADFLSANSGYIADPANSTACSYCAYESGADYLRTMNINEKYYGWRNVS